MQATIFPWQTVLWQHLWQCYQAKRLPHALLVQGAEGLGQQSFCLQVSASLLCQYPEWKSEGAACGQCHSCHLFHAGNHPDFMLLQPGEEATQIKVEQIRDAVHFVNQTTLQSGHRIIIIDPATAMNTHAANSLLKTLEEPPANTLFLLISSQTALLPATIVSRCQKIGFTKPERKMAETWLYSQIKTQDKVDVAFALDLAEGAPLKVLAWLETDMFSLRLLLYKQLAELFVEQKNPLPLALEWQERDMQIFFLLLLLWLKDLLRLQVTEGSAAIVNKDFKDVLLAIHAKINSQWLMHYIDLVETRLSEILSQLHVNRQLMLEEIFIRWVQYAIS